MTVVRAFSSLSTETTLADYRAAASVYVATNDFPNKSLEHWRYSVSRFAAAATAAPANAKQTDGKSALPLLPYTASCVHTLEQPGNALTVQLLDDADTAPCGGFLDSVHAAHVAAGDAIISADAHTSSDKPLLIVRGAENRHSIALTVQKGVRLTLVEKISPDAGAGYRSAFTDITLEADAELVHYVIAETGTSIARYDSMRIIQYKNSRYHGALCVVGNGGAFKRDVDAQLVDEGAENRQYIVHAVGGDALCDHYLPAQHIAPRCSSFQRARYAPSDKALCVYYGRASAAQEAVGTEAHQLNKNILLSPTAKVYSRPELDILTNEIVCSHGSATGGIDEDALYYLQQRGISKQDALSIITAAFLKMDEEAVPDDALRAYINGIIATR